MTEWSPEGLDREWWLLNRPFTERENLGPALGPPWTIRVRGSRLIVTAVHGVNHYRPGIGLKPNDANTGGLAAVLSETLNVTGAWILRADEYLPDANADGAHPFKAALIASGAVANDSVLIDVHGMRSGRECDITLGHGNHSGSRDVAIAMAAVLRSYKFDVDLGGRRTGLSGASPGTMSSWARQFGACAVQIEIAREWRSFRSGLDERSRLLIALLEALGGLERSAEADG
jgi:hypothetical protein